MHSFNPEDSKYRCCCGCCHVERGALIIGILGVVGGLASVISFFVEGLITDLVNGILAIAFYSLLIYAQQQQHPSFYLPFLILEGVRLAFGFLCIVVITIFLIWAPEFWQKFLIQNPDEKMKEHIVALTRGITTFYLVFGVIVEVFTLWFWFVVYRAYQYVKEQHLHYHGHA